MKALTDWSKQIGGLDAMNDEATLALYSEMLATAHDIGHKVPDDQLIETEDPAKLKAVIPALHEGIKAAHAAASKKKPVEFAPATVSKHTVKASELKGGKKPRTTKAPKKPAAPAAQKGQATTETETMGSTAKKAAPAKKAAKVAAKKAAPAKKGAKKAAAANARTGVGRNPFGEGAVIKVLSKETGVSADSERGKRIAVVFKYNGKKVADFYSKEKPPYNRTDTLRFLIDRKFISVK